MIYYTYREQMYKCLLSFNEEDIFENVGGKDEKWYHECVKHKISQLFISLYLTLIFCFKICYKIHDYMLFLNFIIY